MHRLATVCLAMLGAPMLSGCALPYYWQAVGGQIGLMRKRVPIEEVIESADYDTTTRARLETVLDLRKFAVTDLALPDNGSYLTYVDLDRPYVVWNVIATEEFSTDPIRWCFPIAGCVAYRGYFDRADAEAFERGLAERGLDTYSGGSGAYSTLGYFSDPVLSTMIMGSETRVAGVLFHELAHQKVYVKDDSELSEAFATVVEEHGVERWLERRKDAEALERYRTSRRQADEFAALVADQRAELQALYARGLAEAALREAKAAAFDSMRDRYAELRRSWGGESPYDGWIGPDTNNATLVAISTYRRWLPGLRARLAELGLEPFYAEIESLAELPASERVGRLEAWNAESVAFSPAQPR